MKMKFMVLSKVLALLLAFSIILPLGQNVQSLDNESGLLLSGNQIVLGDEGGFPIR
ncbi:MAG: hypothetical protein LBC21_06090 [Oscillospiraceae bacterium]|jgi:hypothetical protein|nr:hypothetical protein [Oscillospiraceae bacterium]